MADFPPVPLTLEGSSCCTSSSASIGRRGAQPPGGPRPIAADAVQALKALEHGEKSDAPAQTALFSQLGHKGDLILMHFRDSVEALNQVNSISHRPGFTTFSNCATPMCRSSNWGSMSPAERPTKPPALSNSIRPSGTPKLPLPSASGRRHDAPPLSAIPDAKYLCFYPMDRKRDEQVNWYTTPFAERQRMMHEHGMIGRRYGDVVRQIISGSIGYDDWEWGVDLFSEDPVTFKKLIYEMRFDQVSAVYALFGQFFIGVRLPIDRLESWLAGKLIS